MKKPVLILLLTFAVCVASCTKTAEELVKSGIAHYEKQEYDKALADFEAGR